MENDRNLERFKVSYDIHVERHINFSSKVLFYHPDFRYFSFLAPFHFSRCFICVGAYVCVCVCVCTWKFLDIVLCRHPHFQSIFPCSMVLYMRTAVLIANFVAHTAHVRGEEIFPICTSLMNRAREDTHYIFNFKKWWCNHKIQSRTNEKNKFQRKSSRKLFFSQ